MLLDSSTNQMMLGVYLAPLCCWQANAMLTAVDSDGHREVRALFCYPWPGLYFTKHERPQIEDLIRQASQSGLSPSSPRSVGYLAQHHPSTSNFCILTS
jgi:hypothetical protein